MTQNIDKSWSEIVENSLHSLSSEYQNFLNTSDTYFPNRDNFLNAFKTLSFKNTKAILFGQDPYPRVQSAIGYAFIDGKVKTLFSANGLSKEVNRATSLRNFMKMLLLADNKLQEDDLSQDAIAMLKKDEMINSIFELKDNFEKNGILLLNTSLVFTKKDDTSLHVKEFKPFVKTFLDELGDKKLDLILFGSMAKDIKKLLPNKHNFTLVETSHPYNVDFITNKKVLEYFSKFKLLKKQ
ncbi:MAG: uracil-DNA glycosylase [Campylobacteraceae bacterium]